jgi:UDP-2,3-diacylglucosamine hydrolase
LTTTHTTTNPPIELALPPGQRIYFASDFHLGAPNLSSSRQRERAIVAWLEAARTDAAAIFLVGDVFDFWFEYRHAIPKGFLRFQGKLAELVDAGIRIEWYVGNHDLWLADYFTDELGIPIHRQPQTYLIAGKRFLVGHGDGLGPGDFTYKRLKKMFESRLAQTLFRWLHPDLGIGLALGWSKSSRIGNDERGEEFLGEDREWLVQYCHEIEAQHHHDFYIFGHRHLTLDLPIGPNSRYINLGEWVTAKTYAVFDGETLALMVHP